MPIDWHLPIYTPGNPHHLESTGVIRYHMHCKCCEPRLADPLLLPDSRAAVTATLLSRPSLLLLLVLGCFSLGLAHLTRLQGTTNTFPCSTHPPLLPLQFPSAAKDSTSDFDSFFHFFLLPTDCHPTQLNQSLHRKATSGH